MSGRTKRYKKSDNPTLKRVVADTLGSGGSLKDAAQASGLSRSSIVRLRDDDDVREMIEKQQRKFLENLPDAQENVSALITDLTKHTKVRQRLMDEDITLGEYQKLQMPYDDKAMAFKASMDMLKSTGMIPSSSLSLTVNNVLNQTNNTLISPVVQNLLSAFTEKLSGATPKEVETYEVEVDPYLVHTEVLDEYNE